MKHLYFLISISFLLIFSCNKTVEGTNSINPFLGKENIYPNGTYCALVAYENPNTGTKSSYTLTVNVVNNEISTIDFPNGGHLDNEIHDASINSSGESSFTLENGKKYTVQITASSDDCFKNVPKAIRCKGITKKGTQCENLTDNPNGLCWQHQNQE